MVVQDHWVPALAAVEARLAKGMTVTAAGLQWKVKDSRENGDRLGPYHEAPAAEAEVFSFLPRGGVFLHVGAHVGHYALRAAKAGASTVIAVEPDPDAASRLAENAELNDLTVTIHQVAAWDDEMPLSLLSPSEHLGSTDGQTVPFTSSGLEVKGVPLDQVLEGEPRLDLVKVDTGGSGDLQAIRGMAGTLSRLRPVLFITDHSPRSYQHAELAELLETYLKRDHSMAAVTW